MNSPEQFLNLETYHNSNNYTPVESFHFSGETEKQVYVSSYGLKLSSAGQRYNLIENKYSVDTFYPQNGVKHDYKIKQEQLLPEISEFMREERCKKELVNDSVFYKNSSSSFTCDVESLSNRSRVLEENPNEISIESPVIKHYGFKVKGDYQNLKSTFKKSLNNSLPNSFQFHDLENKKTLQNFIDKNSHCHKAENHNDLLKVCVNCNKMPHDSNCKSKTFPDYVEQQNVDTKYYNEQVSPQDNQEYLSLNTINLLDLSHNFNEKVGRFSLPLEPPIDLFSHPTLTECSSNKKITNLTSESFSTTGQSTSDIMDDVDWSAVDCSCLERMEKRYQNEAIKDVKLACVLLNLPPEPFQWNPEQVHKWLMWTIHQCSLPSMDINFLGVTGEQLCCMTEDEMRSLAPRCGDILHARLEIWRAASRKLEIFTASGKKRESSALSAKDNITKVKQKIPCKVNTPFQGGKSKLKESLSKNVSIESRASEMTPNHTGGIQLWQFLKELLIQPNSYGQCIRWINKERGIFKIEDSVKVARLWGIRKNRPAMNYDKLSRSIRQYYKKGIIRKTDISQRLVYQFVKPVV